jgi:large subunit ribosomal protein L24
MAAHVRKNDLVKVLSGKERGKTGKVLEILVKKHRARVEKLMIIKKHLKRGRSQRAPQGGIIDEVGTIALANLMLVCPKCKKPSRTGHRAVGGKSVRYCKSCEEVID